MKPIAGPVATAVAFAFATVFAAEMYTQSLITSPASQVYTPSTPSPPLAPDESCTIRLPEAYVASDPL